MKTYKVVSKDTNPDFYEALRLGTTNIVYQLGCVSGQHSAVVLCDGMFDDVITHPAFVQYYSSIAIVCPFMKAFVFGGVWYVDEKEVSPLLIAMNALCSKEK